MISAPYGSGISGYIHYTESMGGGGGGGSGGGGGFKPGCLGWRLIIGGVIYLFYALGDIA